MTPPKRLGAALVVSLATAALSFSTLVTPADAAPAKDYDQVIVRYKAKVEGCKVPVRGGDAFRVYARLDNSNNKRVDSRSAGVAVVKDGEYTNKGFMIGMTPGGKVSKAKSVVVANKPGFTLDIGVGAGQMGDGKTFKLKKIHAC